MDNGIIKTGYSRNGKENLPEKSQNSMPDIVRGVLEQWTPSEFMTAHSPDLGVTLVRRGYTCGQLALNEAIPTLANVAEVYGDATAVAWLKVQLDAVDRVLGAKAFGELERFDAARLIAAKYKEMNVANLLQFFTRYKLGEYVEATAHIGGIQKLMTALRLYSITAGDDARRVAREREDLRNYAQRLEWEKKAISYEEYLKGK